ncbi:MAG: tripartite tricarboxylate transporter substrate binding protein [Alphaproteobacteria bacterium]|nr:MAG: tripartite tricarboxylate transporter substrate binding protein [Alphaproteobacteria bacterium]
MVADHQGGEHQAGVATMRAMLGLALLLLSSGAFAQTNYPETTVRILVGFPAGTAPDVGARIVADKLATLWGKGVIVENISGASGNIAADRAAEAAPDGYTLFMGGNSSLIMSVSLYDKLAYDPVKDFVPITQIFIAANLLVVHPDLPVNSIDELVALAKAKPGQLTYGHTGTGSSQHLANELFKYMTKTDIVPVAYRGSTAILPDLLAGRINMAFLNVVNAAPLVKEGKLRAFAVSSRKRSVAAPELPTMIEKGYPDFEAVPWFGFLAPAGTPQAIVDKIQQDTVAVLAMSDVRKRFEANGLDVVGGTSAEFAKVIKTEIPYWAKIIKEAGIKAE